MQKLDPYLNVDPGTMNPFQHGEVFVTEDGAETDLDVGHYERFLDIDLVRPGQRDHRPGLLGRDRQGAARRVPRRHRAGHPAHHQRDQVADHGRWPRGPSRVDVVITEIGGTVGDIESLPFLEAARQVRHEIGRDNCFFLHISLVPYIAPSGELKTKPTQHSVAALRSIGIQPDALVCRSDREIGDRAQAQDQPDVRRRRRGRHLLRRRAVDLRHPQGAAPRGPRRLRRPPAGAAVPGRRLDGVGRPARPGPRAQADGHHRAGRQVHRPARRLPVGHRGAARRRVRPPQPGADPLGALRRLRRPPRAPRRRWPASTASASPAASASAASRASSARSGTPGSTASRRWGCAWACSAWSSSTPATSPGLEKANSAEFDPETPDAVIATMASQVDVDRRRARPRRHDAAGQLPGQPAEGLGRRGRLRRRPRSPSGTGTATRWPTPTATG